MDPPISHWALKPVAPSLRELPQVLVTRQPILNIDRCWWCLEDREKPLHLLLALVMREQHNVVTFDVGGRVAFSSERREVAGRGRAALALTGLLRAQ